LSDVGAIELQIQKILDEEPTLEHVSNRLLLKVAAPEISDSERVVIWNFLYNTGHFSEALLSMTQRLSTKSRIHWGLFVEILSRLNIEPPNSVLESLFKGIKRQEANDDLWATFSWNHWDARFGSIRQTLANDKANETRQKRENLLEKFHFLKNQRMQEQAGRILKRLIFLYPEESSYVEMKKEFDEEWAREIITSRFSSNDLEATHGPVFSEEEKTALGGLVRSAWKHLEVHPETAFDFAIFFFFLEAWTYSVDFAETAAQTVPSADWLVAELMLKLRRHVDLLEHLAAVEVRYCNDPETAFSVAYLRAQALHALGQSSQAVEILRNIVQVRPDYRSAHQLINEWSVGAVAG
jgi:tetratricopeptide (TPR) repeat protein